jgi:hypothetical protein
MFIFLVIFEELLDAAMWLKVPKGKWVGISKKKVLLIKSWIYLFFELKKLSMVLHDVIFNKTIWI